MATRRNGTGLLRRAEERAARTDFVLVGSDRNGSRFLEASVRKPIKHPLYPTPVPRHVDPLKT